VLFAHRGARAHAPENTIEAFTLALRLGASGLESDVWLTADGVAVLDHDGVVGGPFRRRSIASVDRSALPEHVPTLAELYDSVGPSVPLSLDVKDPAAFDEVVRVARTVGAVEHLWLCHPDASLLAGWRSASEAVRLVHSTRLGVLGVGPERHAARLRADGIDGINLHHAEWSGGLTALVHRFGRLALGWDAQHVRVIRGLLDIGIDGVFSDHVDRLVDAASGPGDAGS
jgi:glycerophosphoryl diester phosphodiesterase